MANITSHTLDGFSGNHAAGIEVFLIDTKDLAAKSSWSQKWIGGGRVSIEIQSEDINPSTIYELVFETGAYWEAIGIRSAKLAKSEYNAEISRWRTQMEATICQL